MTDNVAEAERRKFPVLNSTEEADGDVQYGRFVPLLIVPHSRKHELSRRQGCDS